MAMTPLPGVGGMLFGGGSSGVPQGTVSAGSQSPGEMTRQGGGKNAVSQNLHSPYSGLRSTVTKGDTFSRLTNNYGKGHSLNLLSGGHSKNPNAPGVNTAGQANPALHQLRGGLGQMRRIRGGLGPGKVGQPGMSNQDYSMSSPDTE